MHKVFTSIVFTSLIWSAPLQVLALTPNDPLYADQWYLERIGASAVWGTTTGSRDVIVAVLDSGVDLVHEDLKANIWQNEKDIPNDGFDNDNNGFIDDTWGYDFVLNGGNPYPVASPAQIDSASTLHGTLVSGIIGAVGNNGLGVAGVNWNVQILPVRVLDELGNGNGHDIAEGLRYAVDQGASVINLSFSGTVDDPSITDALQYAYDHGVIVVSAVGNENTDVNEKPAYPACSREGEVDDLVIGVAASDEVDEKATFSNYGKSCIDVAAPGTMFTGLAYYDPRQGFIDKYTSGWSGTSLAAPLVTGTVALISAYYPGFSPAQMKTILQLSADPIEGAYRADMGAGRLNIDKAFVIAGQMWQDIAPTTMDLDFVKIPSSSTVYVLMPDGTRRMVLDTNTFYTYTKPFTEVRVISDAEIAQYKLRGVVLPQANRVLVKIQSDPKVYWLAKNVLDPLTPTLRSIPDEATAQALFGEDWNQYVIDIDITMFQKFRIGNELSSTEHLRTNDLIPRMTLTSL